MAGWRRALEDATGRPARLAGSGSTWFVDLGRTTSASRSGRGWSGTGSVLPWWWLGRCRRLPDPAPYPGPDDGSRGDGTYLPAARRCQRVAFSIFLCFFLRMRLRRFLIRDPMSGGTLVDQGI